MSQRDKPRNRNISPPKSSTGERLQKALAAAGVASRRECEELILAGRVEVDRETVTVLGTRVDPARQEIRVDGVVLARPRHVYYVVNKPAGILSTNRDPEGRPRVIDLVPAEKRLFTIGRLDRSSEGMMIVTNDGELANQLTHPRYGIPKTYRASVLGSPTAETLQQLRKGVHLAEGFARVASLRMRGRHPRGAELEIVLTEGRNREIRRILARVGHKVLRLRRTAIGPIRLGKLKTGEFRVLTADEIRVLRRLVRTGADTGRAGRRGGKAKSVRASQSAARSGSAANRKLKTAAGQQTKTKRGGSPGKPKPSTARASDRGRTGAVLDYDQPQGERGKGRTAKKQSGKGKRR